MISQTQKWLKAGAAVLIFSTAFLILLNPIRTLLSFKKMEGVPLYSLTYYGRSYDFLHFTVPQSEEELNNTSSIFLENQACTIFSATAGEKMIYGRNRDLHSSNTALLLYSDPPDGYASLSIVDLDQLGVFLQKDQESLPLFQRFNLLAAPLLPTEGMNEFGLTIAKADSPSESVRPFDPAKDSLLFRTAMREVLDHAKTTEEAIGLLDQYNVAFGATGGHFLIADPTGNSAIIEFFDNKMQIIRDTHPWQVITNFNVGQLTEGQIPECNRYTVTEESLSAAQGRVSADEALHLLEQASIPETLWSIVFNLTDRWMAIALYRQYDEIIHVSFDDW